MRVFEEKETHEISYAIADKVFCIVNLSFPWVNQYESAFETIAAMAKEKGCTKLAAFYTRKSSGAYLKSKGWTEREKGIVEYVL